jgi:hypothetical protein
MRTSPNDDADDDQIYLSIFHRTDAAPVPVVLIPRQGSIAQASKR